MSRERVESVFRTSVVWLSGILLVGAVAWNVVVGDWIDGVFLLGFGIGGALLLGARERPEDTLTFILRGTGIALLVVIALVQLGMLLRYAFLR